MSLDEIGGWFPQENRTELERLISQHDIHSVLEIGSFLGLSAAWFASRPGVERVTCVDLWRETATEDSHNNLCATLRRFGIPRDFYRIFVSNMQEFGVWNRIYTVRGNSRDVHGRVGDHDLVYIDGDHSYAGCLSDLNLYGPKARKVLCGDDFLAQDTFGVIEAVRGYVAPEHLHTNGPFWWTAK